MKIFAGTDAFQRKAGGTQEFFSPICLAYMSTDLAAAERHIVVAD
jgi:hypothetical protein